MGAFCLRYSILETKFLELNPGGVNRTQSNRISQSKNRNQSNPIERLMFDCRTQSNINRTLPEIFDWFRLRSIE